MAIGYIPLPALKAPAPLDFSGLNEGLDVLGKSIERNRLLTEQKEIGKALASGKQGTATSSSSPQYGPSQTNKLLSPAQASFAAAGRPYEGRSGGGQYANAIAGIETPNFKDPYNARGPVVQGGDRAYGKYQIMGSNIGPWTKEVLGREMSVEEFLANPQAQDAVFSGKFGQYVKQTGNPDSAASMWFTGRPSAPNAQARDVNGNPIGITGREYVEKFRAGIGGGQPTNALISQPAAGPNYSAGMDVALRQGNLSVALDLANAQRQQEDTAYNRSRQARMDAQTSEVNELAIQEKRAEIERAAGLKLAGIAQAIGAQTDPAARAAMWQKFVAVNPRIATTLQQYGIDPRDAEAGARFLIAEARGLTEPKASEFKTFKQDEGIFQSGPTGMQVLREPQPKAEDNKVVSPGQTIVSPAGRPVYTAPDKPLGLENVAPGNTVYDPNSRSVLFRADPKPEDKLSNSKFEQDLRKEYTAVSKDFREVSNGLSRVEAASQLGTGAGDVALIYGFMKINDPGSVVRETEFDIANNIGSLPERWQGYVQKMLTGEGLPDRVRQEIKSTAQTIAQRKIQEQKALEGRFEQIARENGVDPRRVLLPFGDNPQPNSGAQLAPRPQGATDQQIIEEAQKAIQQGKDPAAVRQQLEAWGIRF